MIHARWTDPKLQFLFIESCTELENPVDGNGDHDYKVKLLFMREPAFRSKVLKLIWIGLVLNPAEEHDCVDITASGVLSGIRGMPTFPCLEVLKVDAVGRSLPRLVGQGLWLCTHATSWQVRKPQP